MLAGLLQVLILKSDAMLSVLVIWFLNVSTPNYSVWREPLYSYSTLFVPAQANARNLLFLNIQTICPVQAPDKLKVEIGIE